MKGLLSLLLCFAAAPAWSQAPDEPVVRMSLDAKATIPGQTLVLSVTVLGPTWFPTPPVFPSFERPNLMVRLPPRASGPVSERVAQTTWSGVRRDYHITPMTAGRFLIAPASIKVTIADPQTRKPIISKLRTEEVIIVATLPAGARDLNPFIGAEAVKLTQTIAGTPSELEPGGTFTRTVKAQITGTSPIVLPPLITGKIIPGPGLAAYPREPVVTENESRGVRTGVREETVTYVAEAGGRHRLPAITLRWFNLETEGVETAGLPAVDIAVSGPLPGPAAGIDWRAAAPWLALSTAALLLAAGFSIGFGPRIKACIMVWRRQRRGAARATEAYVFAQVETALRSQNLGVVMQAIELWSARLPPVAGSSRATLSAALSRLGAANYSAHPPPESGDPWSELCLVLRQIRSQRLAAAAAKGTEVLPPLNPERSPSSPPNTQPPTL